MTSVGKDLYCLSRKGLRAFAEGSVDKLKPVLALNEGSETCAILETFDQSLLRSGRLLLETGGLFELLTADGKTLTQSAERSGDFVADFQDGAVKRNLADVSSLRSLRPIVSGTLRSGILALLDCEQKTHCRASLRVVSVGDDTRAAIVTLQGLRGYDKSLAALRKHIRDCGGETLSRSKFYDDLCPGYSAYDPKPEVIIDPDDTAFTAASDIVAAYIPVARANETGIIEDRDTEFLHDYRVALRKIRSVIELFKGVYRDDQTRDLKARFAALMRPTGRVRDLDVYLLGRQHFQDLLPKSLHGGLDSLFEMIVAKREAERVALSSHLASAAYQDEMEHLAGLFERRKKLRHGRNADLAAQNYACSLMWKRYQKICEAAKGIGSDTTDADIHLLRIQCKKLRYLMEFFGQLFPQRDFKALLGPLKVLQDRLGLYNDYSVQQISLQEFLSASDDVPHSVNLQIAQSIGALIAVLHGKQLEERVGVFGTFAQFNSPETQQRFRTLFHGQEGEK
jgi:CHAD domain-containing protein